MAESLRVRVLLLGDTHAGKSSVLRWILGCPSQLVFTGTKMHYQRLLARNVCVELVEVPTTKHINTRNMLYVNQNGLILVHDLTNPKSYQNCWKWMDEIVDATGADAQGFPSVPILLIGTKADLQPSVAFQSQPSFLDEFGVYHTNSSDIVNQFFDTVITKRYLPAAQTPKVHSRSSSRSSLDLTRSARQAIYTRNYSSGNVKSNSSIENPVHPIERRRVGGSVVVPMT